MHLSLGELHPARLPKGAAAVVSLPLGNRPSQAVAALRDAGYGAVNVDGGMNAWRAHGLSVVRDDSRPGTVA